jgi:hypothetical protein
MATITIKLPMISPTSVKRVRVSQKVARQAEKMPPESAFRPEFIAKVERICLQNKNNQSKSQIFRTKSEIDNYFQKIWNE